jgi:hypothetical protein
VISKGGIIYPDPVEQLIVPVRFGRRPRPLAVHYRTWLCDGRGRILKPLQAGWNEITDYGMDLLATTAPQSTINYLHLSSSLDPAKKVLTGGTTLSLTSIADPTNVPVVASTNFFAAGDTGNTLYIDGIGQELKIIAYTDPQHVTCATRQGVWLPGSTPGLGPFASAGVHYTATNTLAADFQAFNTYDTSAPNYNVELNNSANQRFIHQRIFLSGAAPSPWTINELGWSNSGTVGGNVFGKVNLLTPDNVGTGQKYRVQLDLYSGYTPINITGFVANWGAVIGTYTIDIQQNVLPYDSTNLMGPNFLRPYWTANANYNRTFWQTSTWSWASTKWEGDSGFNRKPYPNATNYGGNPAVTSSTYTNGTHYLNRTWKMDDTINIVAATGIVFAEDDFTMYGVQLLALAPQSGTITKPNGYYAALTFPVYWTRAFVN